MLTTQRNDIEIWQDLESHEFVELSESGSDKIIGIIFKCPGCNEALHVSSPHWQYNHTTKTATPSILHKKNGLGCGWHGYLTNGQLTGKIE